MTHWLGIFFPQPMNTLLLKKTFAAALLFGTLATPALAADNVKPLSKKEDTVCIQAAVGVRETSLGAGFAAFASTVSAAYSTRQPALLAAWEIVEKSARKTAVKAAWTSFSTSKKSAAAAWKKTRTDAWKAFSTAAKTCKVDVSAESSGRAIDAQ